MVQRSYLLDVMASIASTASQEFMAQGAAKDEGQDWREDAKFREYEVSKHAGWSRTTDSARVPANRGRRWLGIGRFSDCGLGGPSCPPHPEQYRVSGSQDVHPQYGAPRPLRSEERRVGKECKTG